MKRFTMLNMGDKKMKHSFSFNLAAIVATLFFTSATLRAQNNPGYLGYTQSIDLTLTPQFFNLLAGGPTLKPGFGLAYEKSTKSRFSWRLGYNMINNTVSQENLDYYQHYLDITDPSKPFDYSREYVKGEFDYCYTAFSLATKFFKNSKGAVAPYGNYWGMELDYGTATVTDGNSIITLVDPGNGVMQPVKFENDPWKKIKILSLHFTVGQRRYFGTSGISCFYQAGVGYPLWQGANGLRINRGETFENHQDLIENAMVRHIANAGIVEFKFGLGYGIK
jgi:hypothetical protein